MQRSACRPIGFTLVMFLFDKMSMKSRALFMELVFVKQTSTNQLLPSGRVVNINVTYQDIIKVLEYYPDKTPAN